MLSCFWVGFVERLTSVIRCKLCNYKQTTQDIFITESSGYIGYYYYLRKCKSCVCFLGMYLVPIGHDHASLSLLAYCTHTEFLVYLDGHIMKRKLPPRKWWGFVFVKTPHPCFSCDTHDFSWYVGWVLQEKIYKNSLLFMVIYVG